MGGIAREAPRTPQRSPSRLALRATRRARGFERAQGLDGENGVLCWDPRQARPPYFPRMDPLTIFGLFAVTVMLVFYALEDRNSLYILGFALACVLGSVYGFLQGAWPFGIIEAVWAVVAARRWWLRRAAPSSQT